MQLQFELEKVGGQSYPEFGVTLAGIVIFLWLKLAVLGVSLVS